MCDAVREGRLSADYCKSEVYGDRNSLFYELWGPNWERLKPGSHACWDDAPGGATAFFQEVFDGDGCSANWFTAAKGALSSPDARPRFTGEAKAVLGFDPDIFDYCSDLVNQPHWCAKPGKELQRSRVASNRRAAQISAAGLLSNGS